MQSVIACVLMKILLSRISIDHYLYGITLTDWFFFFSFRSMASNSDQWVKEYNEAMKLADDISSMVSEWSSNPASGPETQRQSSAIRRKITILGTRLDSLQSLLSKLPAKPPL
jgi:SYP5 family syntaxin